MLQLDNITSDKVGGGSGDPRGTAAGGQVGGLQESDPGAGGGVVLAHGTGHLLRDGAAVVARGAGGAPDQAAPRPASRSCAHIIRQQAFP